MIRQILGSVSQPPGIFGRKAEDPSYDLAFLVFFFLALALDACLYFGPLFAAASTARSKRVHLGV
jgi:hypothetical protein